MSINNLSEFDEFLEDDLRQEAPDFDSIDQDAIIEPNIEDAATNIGYRSALGRGRMRVADTVKGKECNIPEAPGIYRFLNRETGEIEYIGQTINLRRRLQHHVHTGKLDLNSQRIQYGIIRLDATMNDLCNTEISHIQRHNPNSNTYRGGNGRRPIKVNHSKPLKPQIKLRSDSGRNERRPTQQNPAQSPKSQVSLYSDPLSPDEDFTQYSKDEDFTEYTEDEDFTEYSESEKKSGWYAVQVASGCEKRVKSNLEQRIQSFGMGEWILQVALPQTQTVKIRFDDSQQESEEMVFPGYVLVRMHLWHDPKDKEEEWKINDEAWQVVKNTPNVINFVGAEQKRGYGRGRGHVKPLPLSRNEIERIFKQTREQEPVVKAYLTVGNKIIVLSGPFKDFEGEVIEVSSERSKLKALLSIFERTTPVELEFTQVQKISQ